MMHVRKQNGIWITSKHNIIVTPIPSIDVEMLLAVKFRWIPFSGFRGEVENVSANQRPLRPSCFSDRPEKHKRGRGRWELASCQVSLNSVRSFRGEVENVLANQMPWRPSCFSDRPEKHKFARGCWVFGSCQVEFRWAVSEEKSKMWKVNDGRTTDKFERDRIKNDRAVESESRWEKNNNN